MEAIELTYFDTCDVYRMVTMPQPNGSLKQERTKVYTGIKCAYSKGSRPATNSITEGSFKVGESINQIDTANVLYLNPKTTILQGDELVIMTQGRAFRVTAGLPFIYPTHQQLTVEVNRNA